MDFDGFLRKKRSLTSRLGTALVSASYVAQGILRLRLAPQGVLDTRDLGIVSFTAETLKASFSETPDAFEPLDKLMMLMMLIIKLYF